MYCFSFTVSGYSDLTDGSSFETDSQALLNALQPDLSASGFECGDLTLENTGWQFSARKNGTTYLVGGQTSENDGSQTAQVFICHSRSVVDRLLNRNKRAPQNYSEKSLREALKKLPGVSNLQESQNFGEIGADKGAFAAIRQ